jgi:hypothetical protein
LQRLTLLRLLQLRQLHGRVGVVACLLELLCCNLQRQLRLLPRELTALSCCLLQALCLPQLTLLLGLKALHRRLLCLSEVLGVVLHNTLLHLVLHVALELGALNALTSTAKRSCAHGLSSLTLTGDVCLPAHLSERLLRNFLLIRVHE